MALNKIYDTPFERLCLEDTLEEYECFDTCGGSGENIQELCACLDCDKQFSVIYVVDCIVKED